MHMKYLYLMHIWLIFTCLLLLFTIIYWLSGGISTFVHFYKCLKVISSFCFIQIVFIYKWHVIKIDVSFLASDVTIQYGCDQEA